MKNNYEDLIGGQNTDSKQASIEDQIKILKSISESGNILAPTMRQITIESQNKSQYMGVSKYKRRTD